MPVMPVINLQSIVKDPNAVALKDKFKDSTDPKYIGPGTWNVIHRIGKKAITHVKQLEFINMMKDICDDFPCPVCQNHCKEYIKNHPMEDYLDVTINIDGKNLALGMLIWSWKFHNAVNARLNKPIMSWETAYNLYTDTESTVCNKNCAEADDSATHNLSNTLSNTASNTLSDNLSNTLSSVKYVPFKMVNKPK